ncbi:NAD(P)-dependent dehydrogenase, short-chain alcohol dehydrogenase family [Algoriphagus alkaliphilus]|uniref:NAD(P)-dependent dehydrogenase, short-chain alcohol dehydrogenase family n=1 Tax=Algoriphagus alkaliphilus TaxID=279824 RepID=A0A1G5Y6T5_9BACT|nr:SDR family oxidoreductase [Algoriphagus alkaliphilus]SDA77814.1 NAD(P)-dependent dehydrogenase, short-chain alcohol dehydrogenase family [Algoriphagus alkaliphilus]
MSKDLFDLSGRVALITGGAGLLGPEMASALVEKGAKVILADLSLEKCQETIDKLGISSEIIRPIRLDVASSTSWKEALTHGIEHFGKIDILVNGAASTNQSKTANFEAGFENFPEEDWDRIMDINLKGTFLGCQIIGQHMVQNGGGSIINIGSLYGVVSPNHRIYPGTGIFQPVAYGVSKHAVISLTKYLATLWADKHVRVNALSPGGVWNGHEGLFYERYKQLNPSGDMANKSDMNGGIVFLASDASKHVVGHNLIIDGGYSVW